MHPSRRFRPLLVLLALAPALASCSSSSLGRAPDALIELFDMASPDGVIEIEIDRDGRIREMEADIPISAVPENVRAAALDKAPGAIIVGAERELQRGGWLWELKLWHDGRNWEYILDDRGRLIETEQALHAFEWPAHVVRAADASLPGGFVKSVELIERRNRDSVYHVKKEIAGVSYKLTVQPDGSVTRRVRETRAEIEIPLRN